MIFVSVWEVVPPDDFYFPDIGIVLPLKKAVNGILSKAIGIAHSRSEDPPSVAASFHGISVHAYSR